ncbi:MAG: glycosyltransferase family 4 protein, partial [Bacteroidales bacterium]|nr:glycosyltransferase family 4 protein [Bacteroidales bacterium]
MKRANIYIFNIGNAWATSGVDRYLEVFSTGFPSDGEFGIYKISLMKDNSHILHTREERNGCMEITIPFPMDSDEVINERYWMRKYNQYVFYLIKDIFEKDVVSVLHIHTLNLIDLAQWIKSQVPLCKIITHLHCIPWKNIFNKNKRKFNKLYCANYLSGKKDWNKNQFLTNNCELDSYIASDKIITVTDCAREFLSRIMEIPEHKITIISNGLYDKNKDSYIRQFKKNTSDTFHCV